MVSVNSIIQKELFNVKLNSDYFNKIIFLQNFIILWIIWYIRKISVLNNLLTNFCWKFSYLLYNYTKGDDCYEKAWF